MGRPSAVDTVALEVAVMRVFKLTLPLIKRSDAWTMVEWMRAVLADVNVKCADDAPAEYADVAPATPAREVDRGR